jgi:hypothetical protein
MKLSVELDKAFQEMEAIIRELGGDIRLCRNTLEQDDTPFWRRTYVRALFAAIEGINYRMKHLAINLSDSNQITFTVAEKAALLEESYDIDDKGNAVIVKGKLRTANNLLFSFKSLAQAFGVSHEVDKNSSEWNCFKEAIKIRDRITHPKCMNDLTISDKEVDIIGETTRWYITSIKQILMLGKEQARKSNTS